MKSGNIENYKKSMENIKFSDYEKEHMIRQLMNGGSANGGRMKGKLDIRKLGIAVAACLTLFSVTAFAAGEAAGIVSWNRIDTRTSSFEDLAKIEEKAELDITAVEAFSNGYTFDCMEVEEAKTQDEDGNDLRHFKGIDITYVKEGCPWISLSADPAEMYDDPHEGDTAVRDIDGITVYYNYTECLNLPVDEEPTQEEVERDKNERNFSISVGSDERYTDYCSSVNFEMNGISYCLLGFDLDMTEDELFDMAEEIISAP